MNPMVRNLSTQNTELVILPNTSHMVPMERADEFNKLVIDFLKK